MRWRSLLGSHFSQSIARGGAVLSPLSSLKPSRLRDSQTEIPLSSPEKGVEVKGPVFELCSLRAAVASMQRPAKKGSLTAVLGRFARSFLFERESELEKGRKRERTR